MTRSPNQIIGAILGAWFCFALALGFTGRFQQASAIAIALTVWGLAALVFLACWKIRLFRNWVADVPFRTLVWLHVTRFIGIYFLVLGSQGRLPNGFAKPAGIGDIVIALGAVLLLAAPNIRSWPTVLRIWNFFGFIDIVLVAFNALRFGSQDWQSMSALRALPLSLLPTFLVPLIIATHVLIFIRLTRVNKVSTQ
jgi:hypothetical protein